MGTVAVITASIVSPIASAVPSTRSARSPGLTATGDARDLPRRPDPGGARPDRALRRDRDGSEGAAVHGLDGNAPAPQDPPIFPTGACHVTISPAKRAELRRRAPAPPRARLFAHDATAGGAWNVGSRRRARVDGAPAHVSARGRALPRAVREDDARDAVEGTRGGISESSRCPAVRREFGTNGHGTKRGFGTQEFDTAGKTRADSDTIEKSPRKARVAC